MRRALLLNGFMATGKSAVGRLLAQKTGIPFVDLDQRIEAKHGLSISEIFAQQGEEQFRKWEREALLHELDGAGAGPLVISLGGGALLERELRVDVLARAVVVTLTASLDTIVQRASTQAGIAKRPLLHGTDPGEVTRKLLAQRAASYRECHGQVKTDDKSFEQVAQEVLAIWREDAVAVAAGDQTYRVVIGPQVIEKALGGLLGSPSGALFVTDENVDPLHGAKAQHALSSLDGRAHKCVLTPGEEHKNLAGLSRIFQAAFDGGLDRKATFVGLGGGVVTDMTGFAAASWVRGVRWLGAPTTLLSMVDASVGGKTGVDFHTAKNSVGAFWQPSGVVCDVETLLTETQRAYVGALSEVVKTALIGDAPLFTLLEEQADAILKRDLTVMQEIVQRCVRVKARIVALDERESGLRASLNLGHTIGHALEASGGYTALTHGEAVSLGLVAALRLGQLKGHTTSHLTQRVVELLTRLGLPHSLSKEDLMASVQLLSHDKKRAGSEIRFIYASGVGHVFGQSIALAELEGLTPQLAD